MKISLLKLRKIFAVFVVALAANNAMPTLAADAGDGYVTGFVLSSSGVVFFFQSGQVTGTRPNCDNSGLLQRWAFDSTTPAGQSMLSLLLTAKNAHQILRITGSGTCRGGSNSEAPTYIVTDDVQ